MFRLADAPHGFMSPPLAASARLHSRAALPSSPPFRSQVARDASSRCRPRPYTSWASDYFSRGFDCFASRPISPGGQQFRRGQFLEMLLVQSLAGILAARAGSSAPASFRKQNALGQPQRLGAIFDIILQGELARRRSDRLMQASLPRHGHRAHDCRRQADGVGCRTHFSSAYFARCSPWKKMPSRRHSAQNGLGLTYDTNRFTMAAVE